MNNTETLRTQLDALQVEHNAVVAENVKLRDANPEEARVADQRGSRCAAEECPAGPEGSAVGSGTADSGGQIKRPGAVGRGPDTRDNGTAGATAADTSTAKRDREGAGGSEDKDRRSRGLLAETAARARPRTGECRTGDTSGSGGGDQEMGGAGSEVSGELKRGTVQARWRR